MIFAELGGSARRVEVAQRDVAQPVGAVVTLHDAFHKELRPAVRVSRILRVLFGDGNLLRLAVGRAGRGEDDLSHTGPDERVEERYALLDIINKVAPRVFDR